jgi:hypothetical protein
MRKGLTIITIAIFSMASTAAFANKGCNDIPSRCAIEVGGRCDLATGRWAVGKNGASGTTNAHNDCISRELMKKQQKK